MAGEKHTSNNVARVLFPVNQTWGWNVRVGEARQVETFLLGPNLDKLAGALCARPRVGTPVAMKKLLSFLEFGQRCFEHLEVGHKKKLVGQLQSSFVFFKQETRPP